VTTNYRVRWQPGPRRRWRMLTWGALIPGCALPTSLFEVATPEQAAMAVADMLRRSPTVKATVEPDVLERAA